jgi:hypothetical protein
MEGTNYIYNNVVTRTAGSSAWGSAIAFQNKYGGSGTVHITNNTIKLNSNATHGININSPAADNWTVKNNLVWKTVGKQVCLSLYTANESPSNIDYNLLYNEGGSEVVDYAGNSFTWSELTGAGLNVNGLNSAPGLDDSLAPDNINDAAVDSGIAIPTYTDDINGIKRPQGSAWDIGAFEFKQYSSENPSPPSNIRIKKN